MVRVLLATIENMEAAGDQAADIDWLKKQLDLAGRAINDIDRRITDLENRLDFLGLHVVYRDAAPGTNGPETPPQNTRPEPARTK